MNKKDYIALAKLIEDNTKVRIDHLTTINGKPKIIDTILLKHKFMDDLCTYLKSDNPNFNESKFREACGE